MVFAKKGEHKNVGNDVYTADVYSFTKGRTYEIAVSKKYINKGDKILVIDDFLANGQAVLGLKSLIEQGGAEMVGAGIAIEKAFQPGRQKLKEAGIDLRALAVIESMSPETGVKFGTN
jgi:xanthine phosphoribosyltransferase